MLEAPDPSPAGAVACRLLRLEAGPEQPGDGEIVVVLDPAWTPDPATAAAGRVIPVRDTVGAVLRETDLIAETTRLLDAWAEASGVVDRLAVGGTSFWFYVRQRHWLWLQERVLWALVLRRLVERHGPAGLRVGAGAGALADAARLLAGADGRSIEVEPPPGEPSWPPDSAAPSRNAFPVVPARSLAVRISGRLRRAVGRATPADIRAAGRAAGLRDVAAKVDRLATDGGGRLLVVMTHAPQWVETADGRRLMSPYFGSVTERLRGTKLDPVLLDWRAHRDDPAALARTIGPGSERVLPRDACFLDDRPLDPSVARAAAAAAGRIADIRVAVPAAGIDLGPALAADVAGAAVTWLPQMHHRVERIARLLTRLRPAGILIVDEYHRQDWREAAARAGVLVAAVEHGTISRHHQGYVHRIRPARLRLPDRTYVFGRWERDRLVEDSVYRDDEVVVGGSPRLDLVPPRAAADRDAVRAELGVAEGDRMVVLSGTWGDLYRRVHYPVLLAGLFDRPLPGIHLVVKQHPSERDEGHYRAVVESVARAGGFAPPPITVVRDIDLYRLLAASDAHLGVHSTVLTEAVFVGTPNLLAAGVRGGDLLDYVDAGVALPVATGADMLAALDAIAAGAITHAARVAFLAAHFEPGRATDRIADDLLAWLP